MSWDNYGRYGWHLDHIRPFISFDLTDKEQQQQSLHYTNMQPLWAKDNIIKGGKWTRDDKQVVIYHAEKEREGGKG
jgi:tRNA(Leu) C34 or U34 (ribose-2'-O)-methylase TrmL